VLASVVVLALVVGLSPLPIVPALYLLGGPNGSAPSRFYLGGWLVGLTGLIAATVILGNLGDPYSDAQRTAGWLEVAVGGLLLVVALGKIARSRRDGGQDREPTSWQTSLVEYDSRRSARLGLIFAVGNPKNFVAALAAGAEIALLSSSLGMSALAVAAFVIVGSAGVGVPVITAWVLGERARPGLEQLQRFLASHGGVLSVVVLAAIGLVLFLRGLSGVL